MNTLEIADFGRDNLSKLLRHLDARLAVEVGVADGVYSETLMKHNPQMKLWGVDPYIPYKGYRDYTRGTTFNNMQIKSRRRLEPYKDRYTFVKKMSMEALGDFEDNSLDFVYLDGNHTDPFVTQDIEGWYKKVKKGGIMAGHDYIRTKDGEGIPLDFAVKDAILKFAKENNKILFILGTNAIREGEIRDKSRSWMVIK